MTMNERRQKPRGSMGHYKRPKLSRRLPWSLTACFGLVWICAVLKLVSANASEEPRPVESSWLDRYVEPFNVHRHLPNLEFGDVEYEDLGPINLIGSSIKPAKYFKCSFHFYSRGSRDGSVLAYQPEPTIHLMPDPTRRSGNVTKKYQFDLTRLIPEKNSFDPRKRTIIVIPGFLSKDAISTWMAEIKNNWLNIENVNVILVEWNAGNTGLYESAARDIRIVARQVVILLYYLSQLHGVDFNSDQFCSNIYLVGHSLGAHIAGYVGQELGGKVARITGLDPAGPIFEQHTIPGSQLSRHDAKFVDIFHTNAGSMNRYYNIGLGLVKSAYMQLWKEVAEKVDDTSYKPTQLSTETAVWFGIQKKIGHIDYFINGGSIQPGCTDKLHTCDHGRATHYYSKVLEYQLEARNTYGEDNPIYTSGLYRLLAFKADDSSDFKTGASFTRNCPELVVSDERKLNRANTDLAYKKCSIPIDFVKPIEEYRKELIEQYNLTIEAGQSAETSYYFDTLPFAPFVSDTYIFKMHLSHLSGEIINWSVSCRFYSKVRSLVASKEAKLYSQIEYQPDYLEPVETQSFYGIVLPTLNPNNWHDNFPTERKIMENIESIDNGSNKLALFLNLRKLVPNVLMAGLVDLKVSPQNAISRLGNLLSFGGAGKPTPACAIPYTAIELKPMNRAFNQSFSLWFTANDPSKTTAGDQLIIKDQYELLKSVKHPNLAFKFNATEEATNLQLKAVGISAQQERRV